MNLKSYTRQFVCYLLAMTIAGAQTRGPVTLPQGPLFGWADLHAHPATHLGFGANNGNAGMFLGKPGGRFDDTTTLATDLPRCNYIHGGTDLDHIKHETHKALMGKLDQLGGVPHLTADFGDNNFGWPSFDQWPHARGVTHQQMHITQIRRAYEGGQRLMIASATDNEFLNDMWAQVGYNALGNPVPAITPDFGYESAKQQLLAIRTQVLKNSDWMELALDAASARRIISQNKMAIILGVEMDDLSLPQLEDLVKNHGVRQVIPIHLIDNLYGGTAVYSDAFNTLNNFYWSGRGGPWNQLKNDGFFKVEYDPTVEFRLGWPYYPLSLENNILEGGGIDLRPIPAQIYMGLGYDKRGNSDGHINARGLNKIPFALPTGGTGDIGVQMLRSLAQRGVLIDVSHMGTKSIRDTLDVVEKWGYPVMSSHTDIRPATGVVENERALERSQAKRIGALGGVIGLGTDWPHGFLSLIRKDINTDRYWRLGVGYHDEIQTNAYETPNLPLKTIGVNPVVTRLKLPLTTGQINSNGPLFAVVRIGSVEYSYQLNQFNEHWAPNSLHTAVIDLPPGTLSSSLKSIRFKVNPGTAWSIANYDVQAVAQEMDPISTWLATYKDGLQLMGGKGMAIGTDINGFAPQLWLPADHVKYPLEAGHNIGPSRVQKPLDKYKLGSRTFDFYKDGIAHYGMLPDFLEAVSQKRGSDDATQQLFHSVEDVVAMWEKCEAARGKVK